MTCFLFAPPHSRYLLDGVNIGSTLAGLFVSLGIGVAQAPKVGDDNKADQHPLTTALVQNIGKDRALIAWLVQANVWDSQRFETIRADLDRIFRELEQKFPSVSDQLHGAVVATGTTTRFQTKSPTGDWKEIRSALRAIRPDGSGYDAFFTGVRETAKKLQGLQKVNPRKLIIVLVTAEVGDDAAMADEVIELLVQKKVSFHAMAPATIFGRESRHDLWIDPKTRFRFYLPRQRGLFTRRLEFVAMSREESLLSAGFGEFHLAALAHRTGGRYFPRVDDEVDAPLYGRELLVEYAPDYSDLKSYETVELKPHRLILVKAAESIAKSNRPLFFKRWIHDPTQNEDIEKLSKECTVAQEGIAAALSLLQQSEKEWAAESTPRWQANYQLSMGRLVLAKASIDELQKGIAEFQANRPALADPNNNGWTIHWTGELRNAANLELQIESQEHFNQVFQDHPGTPWFFAAEREKPHLAGVRWKEGFDRDFVRPEDRKIRDQVKPPRP